MCGRFNQRTPFAALAEQFLADLNAELAWQGPRYNVAPTQSVPTVRLVDGKRQLAMLHWGLVPAWAKERKFSHFTINARADTVAIKPAFRAAYKSRRCLVLADGFYEWERAVKAKLPWLFGVDGGRPFAFAGLWESWRGAGDEQPLESCTIVTTDANELVGQLHDRMPMILDAADYDDWLSVELIPLVPFAANRMTARSVSTFVNNVRNQGPECIEAREPLPATKPKRADSSQS